MGTLTQVHTRERGPCLLQQYHSISWVKMLAWVIASIYPCQFLWSLCTNRWSSTISLWTLLWGNHADLPLSIFWRHLGIIDLLLFDNLMSTSARSRSYYLFDAKMLNFCLYFGRILTTYLLVLNVCDEPQYHRHSSPGLTQFNSLIGLVRFMPRIVS